MRRFPPLCLLATLTLLILPAAAQQPTDAPPAAPAQAVPAPPPAPTFTIRTSTRLVILDLVVEDGKGNVVQDLKKEDFHVSEAGEPQTILNFDTTGVHTPDPSITINSTAELDKLAPRAPVNILLLDEFNTRFEDMAFARYSLKKFLERQPGKLPIPTMLIAVNLKDFSVLHDYTQNKDEIISALDHHFSAYPWQAHQYAWLSERYATAFESLRRVAEASIGHQGQKNMIWIGRGFPAINFANTPVDTENRVYNAVQECVNVLRDARVTLYTIDPAGLQVYNTYGSAAEFNDPFGGNYQFAKLATATGGRTLYGRNDVDAEIDTAIRDGSNAYTLTYRPTNAVPNPARFRKIVVTVDRPGAKVYTREGYYLQRGPGRVDPANPSRRLMADLNSADSSTMVYDGVPLTLQNNPAKPEDYILHIDAHALSWTPATDTEPRKSEVILMVTTYDKKNKELKRDARVIKAIAPKTVPPTGRIERPINIEHMLPPDPKAVRVRFTIRVTASGRIGTVDAVPGQVIASQTPFPTFAAPAGASPAPAATPPPATPEVR